MKDFASVNQLTGYLQSIPNGWEGDSFKFQLPNQLEESRKAIVWEKTAYAKIALRMLNYECTEYAVRVLNGNFKVQPLLTVLIAQQEGELFIYSCGNAPLQGLLGPYGSYEEIYDSLMSYIEMIHNDKSLLIEILKLNGSPKAGCSMDEYRKWVNDTGISVCEFVD